MTTYPYMRNSQLEEALTAAKSGDPAALERAWEVYSATSYVTGLLAKAADFAALGDAQRDQAGALLASKTKELWHYPKHLSQTLNALLDLGPTQHERFRAAFAEIREQQESSPVRWGVVLGILRRPFTEVPADVAPPIAAEALRSLRQDPARFLPHRGDGWTMYREDRVVAELLTGDPAHRSALAAALAGLADDGGLDPLLRYRAVASLELADSEAGQAAAARLRASGVTDPGERVPDAAVMAEVDRAWDRLEEMMRASAPDQLDKLGPPLPPAQVALARQFIGIPDDFAACLARHRHCWAGGEEELCYEDIGRMLEDVEEDWWSDSGDWGDLPDLGDGSSWLPRIRAYTASLEASIS